MIDLKDLEDLEELVLIVKGSLILDDAANCDEELSTMMEILSSPSKLIAHEAVLKKFKLRDELSSVLNKYGLDADLEIPSHILANLLLRNVETIDAMQEEQRSK